MDSISISNCEFVDVDSRRVFSRASKELFISSVKGLEIQTNTLSKTTVVTIEDVGSLHVEESAFDSLVADKVIFRKVNFSTDAGGDRKLFKPSTIQSLEFDGCFIAKGISIDQDSTSQGMDSVVFRGCRDLGKVDVKLVDVTKFTMTGNHFNEFPNQDSIQVKYSELEIANNFFKGPLRLPEIRSTASAGVIEVSINLNSGKNVSKSFRTWMESFKLEDSRGSSRSLSPCTQGKSSDKHIHVLVCPTAIAMQNYVKEDKISTLPFETAKVVASSSYFLSSLPAFILTALSVLILSF